MNVLHTIISFNVGGAEKLLVDTMNNWDCDNDSIILCIINNSYKDNMINRINNRDGLKIEYLNREIGSKNLNFLRKYISLIKENKIDIIHCHDKESVIIGSIAKLIYPKLKIYYTVHDTGIYETIGKTNILMHKIFVKNMIAISDAVKKDILSRGIKENKVTVIHNGIDFSPYEKIIKQKDEYYNIGCVARIQPKKKGQDVLINAIKIVKDKYPIVRCYFAGGYEEKDKSDMDMLKRLIDENGLAKNIFFLGSIDNVPKFLENMDLFVLPSRQEGFGLVVVEAMAAKIPVIASDIDGPKEIIGDNKYGTLFKSENHIDLANKIIMNIENHKDVYDVYSYAKKNFSINSMIDKLLEVYRK